MASELAAAGVMIGHAASNWIRSAEEKKINLLPVSDLQSRFFKDAAIVI